MGEEAIRSGRQEALGEVTMLLDVAISRLPAAVSSMAGLRSRSAGAGKWPGKSLYSSRSRTALQTVTLTRR
jgi:hypothetical protein